MAAATKIPGGEKKTTSFIPCIMAREGIAYFIGRLTRSRPALYSTTFLLTRTAILPRARSKRTKVKSNFCERRFTSLYTGRNIREITLAVATYEVPRDSRDSAGKIFANC